MKTLMLSRGDYVRRKGTERPVGEIEALNDTNAFVLWGAADRRVYREEIPLKDLERFTDEIVTNDEITLREIENAKKF